MLPNWLKVIGLGFVLGAASMGGVTLSLLDSQRDKVTHWRDSTNAVYAADTARLNDHLTTWRQRAEGLSHSAAVARDSADRERARHTTLVAEVSTTKLRLAEVHTTADSLLAVLETVELQDSLVHGLERENGQLRKSLEDQARVGAALLRALTVADSSIAVRDQRIAALDSALSHPTVEKKSLFSFLRKFHCGPGAGYGVTVVGQLTAAPVAGVFCNRSL